MKKTLYLSAMLFLLLMNGCNNIVDKNDNKVIEKLSNPSQTNPPEGFIPELTE